MLMMFAFVTDAGREDAELRSWMKPCAVIFRPTFGRPCATLMTVDGAGLELFVGVPSCALCPMLLKMRRSAGVPPVHGVGNTIVPSPSGCGDDVPSFGWPIHK